MCTFGNRRLQTVYWYIIRTYTSLHLLGLVLAEVLRVQFEMEPPAYLGVKSMKVWGVSGWISYGCTLLFLLWGVSLCTQLSTHGHSGGRTSVVLDKAKYHRNTVGAGPTSATPRSLASRFRNSIPEGVASRPVYGKYRKSMPDEHPSRPFLSGASPRRARSTVTGMSPPTPHMRDHAASIDADSEVRSLSSDRSSSRSSPTMPHVGCCTFHACELSVICRQRLCTTHTKMVTHQVATWHGDWRSVDTFY